MRNIAIAGVVALVLAVAAKAESGSARYEIREEKSVMIPMRDGTLLSTDLYMP